MGTGLLTAIVAALGLMIAYFQFVTARRKLMLDLFDRRLKVLEGLERAIGAVFSGMKVTNEIFNDLLNAKAAARFLFGEDVQAFLQKTQEDFAFFIAYSDEMLADPEAENRVALIERKYEILNRFAVYPQTLAPLFGPYMKFTEKQTKVWLPW